MAELPLAKLLRILSGVALGYGPLGHQVLGQLLVLNTNELEIAAASTLIAAASGQRNALAYTSIRVLAPAIAVHLLTRRDEKMAQALWQRLAEKEAELAKSSAAHPPKEGVTNSRRRRPARLPRLPRGPRP